MIDSFYYFHKAESVPTVSMVQKCEVHSTEEAATVQSSERFYEPSDHTRIQQISSIDAKQQVGNLLQGSPSDTSSLTSWLREYMMKFGSSLRSQNHLPLIIVIIVAVIFIMQVCTSSTGLSITYWNLQLHTNDELPRVHFSSEFLLWSLPRIMLFTIILILTFL